MKREVFCGVLSLVFGVVYYIAAMDVPQSMLSDEVGADGIPKALAVAFMIFGVLQVGRAFLGLKAAESGELAGLDLRTHLRSFGMIAIGIGYLIATPFLGYPLTVTVLIFVVAVYAGQALTWRLAGISAVGGFAMWFCFVKALGITMPTGVFGRLLG
jgi:putative tricarboxylic transport membrane protein